MIVAALLVSSHSATTHCCEVTILSYLGSSSVIHLSDFQKCGYISRSVSTHCCEVTCHTSVVASRRAGGYRGTARPTDDAGSTEASVRRDFPDNSHDARLQVR